MPIISSNHQHQLRPRYSKSKGGSDEKSSVDSFVMDAEFSKAQTEEERGLGNLNIAEGSGLTFSCNVAGYQPDQLAVGVEANELVITGEQRLSGIGQSMQRSFIRRVTLPDSILKDSIQCQLDENGRLEVVVHRKHTSPQTLKRQKRAARPTDRSIPISYQSYMPMMEDERG